MGVESDYSFYDPRESFERLVADIHFINHQWHGLEGVPGSDALREELRSLKDLRQLRLIRFHAEWVDLELSEEMPGTFLIRLRRLVGRYDHAAHIPVHKVPK
ncbi:MAG: hypothetical protein FJ138_04155 [Deltaproteobacteria bacterium]|nr:hypothetical protein [Deltaproteobacteria bacterium]